MNRQIELVAARFNAPAENVRRQYAKNAAGLRAMAAKARASKTGKCNHYTASELDAKAAEFERIATG